MTDTLVPVDKLPSLTGRKALANFKRLAEIGDELVEQLRAINQATREVNHLRCGIADPLSVELPEEDEIALTAFDRDKLARARVLLAQCDPDAAYEDEESEDGQSVLRRAVIAKRLALMIDSFPSAKVEAPQNFAAMLVAHVEAAETTCVALHSACVELESTRKTPPSIANVLETIAAHYGKWEERRYAIHALDQVSKVRLADLRAVRGEVERAQHAAAVSKARREVGQMRQELILRQTRAAEAARDVAFFFERLAKAQRELQAIEATQKE